MCHAWHRSQSQLLCRLSQWLQLWLVFPAALIYHVVRIVSLVLSIIIGVPELNETQKEYQELARKFTAEEIIPKAAELDISGEYPWEILKKAWELGLLNNHIPADIGKN